MWRWIKWTFRIVVVLIVALFFHYVLPQHDVVRVTDTSVIRMDFTATNRLFYAQADAGNVEGTTRDVRLINAVRPSDRVDRLPQRGYRLDLAALLQVRQLEPAGRGEDLKSTKAAPQWVGDDALRLAASVPVDLPERGRRSGPSTGPDVT